GFYDVLFKGKKLEFRHPYSSYVMENVLFKVSYHAKFHSRPPLKIKEITNRTYETSIRIIDKQFKPIDNLTDRDHCVQYMVRVMLAFNR
ncbi:2-methylcitrate dehydratase, partial [Capronia epimyces CBS 606.96]